MKRPLFFFVLFAVTGCSTATQSTVPRGVATPRGTIAAIVTHDVPEGNLQVPYTVGFAAVGGAPTYGWTWSSSTLPPGLTLNANTGFLSGVPTQLGSFRFTIQATDQTTPSAQTPTASFTLNIVSIPTGPHLPRLPQVYVDTTMPTVTGTTFNATACTGAGVGIQDRINAAAAADGSLTHAVIITSSLSCNATITLPNKTGANPTGTGWIVIKTSAFASLLAEGTRVVPGTHAGFMPKVLGPSTNTRAFKVNVRTHHYRLIGIEMGMATGVTNTGSILEIDPTATTTGDYPHHIVVDRCYIHGQTSVTARRGIQIGGNNIAIIDSHISDFHEVGSDSQAIAGWNFEGPLKIVNNYLEGSGENVIFGGAAGVVTGVIPSDIEIRRNYFFKPLTWRVGDPSYAGIAWSVKNSLEIKDGQRILVEGNVFEHNWAQSQNGYMILFTPRTQNMAVPQAVAQDITFRWNSLRSASGAINMLARDNDPPPPPPPDRTLRVWIHNNIIEDISSSNWGGPGTLFQMLEGVVDLRIDHNTGFQNGRFISADPSHAPFNVNFVFQDNIFPRGLGAIGSGTAEGNGTLNLYFPGMAFLKNVLVGANPAIYPANNFYPAGPLPSNIGFVNFNGGIGGDYRLLSTSPYKNAGTNAKDPGARAGAVKAAVTGVR